MRIGSLLVASSLSLAVPALAQDQPGAGGTQMPSETGKTGMQPESGTTGMNPPFNPNVKVARRDKEFVEKATSGNLFEVQAAQLALQKSQNDTVKEFAQHMISAHSQVNSQLRQVAQSQGITVPTQMSAEDQKKYDELAKLSGTDFDKAYMKTMVDEHNAAIDLFRKQRDEGKNPELKQFAQQTLPGLRQHADLAKRDRGLL